MPGREQPEPLAAGGDRDAAVRHRPARAGAQRVEMGEDALERGQRLALGERRGRQLAHHALFFLGHRRLELDHAVVGLAHLDRFHEQRLPAARHVVHDAAAARESGRRNQRDEAFAVAGDVRRLAEILGPALEPGVEIALPAPELGARLAQQRRGRIAHPAVGIEPGPEALEQRIEPGQHPDPLVERGMPFGGGGVAPRLTGA